MEDRQLGRAWPAPAFGAGFRLGGFAAGIGPMLAVSPFVYGGSAGRGTGKTGGDRWCRQTLSAILACFSCNPAFPVKYSKCTRERLLFLRSPLPPVGGVRPRALQDPPACGPPRQPQRASGMTEAGPPPTSLWIPERTLSQLIESEQRFRDLSVSRGVPSESRDAFQRELPGRQALVPFPRDHIRSDGRRPTVEIHEAQIRDDGYSSHLSTARQLLRRKAGGSEPVYGRRAGYREFPAGFGHASAARVRMNDLRNSQRADGESRGRRALPSGGREELAPERGEDAV
jgi:hypothetical protein